MNFNKRFYRLALSGILLVFSMLPVLESRPHTCVENSFCLSSDITPAQVAENHFQEKEHSICLACVLLSTWQAFQEATPKFSVPSLPFNVWQKEDRGTACQNSGIIFNKGPPSSYLSD